MSGRLPISGAVARRVIVAGLVALVLVFAAYAYLFFFGHRAPGPFALSGGTPANAGPLDGTWIVAKGSEVGYRVREKFADQPSPTEAVARTSSVTGGFTITGRGANLRGTRIRVTANLTTLKSVDQYAIHGSFTRDGYINVGILTTASTPNAIFVGDDVALPADSELGNQMQMDATGMLTVRGVTRPVVVSVRGQATSAGIELVGSLHVTMSDFGITPPNVGFTMAEDATTIEFDLHLVRVGS